MKPKPQPCTRHCPHGRACVLDSNGHTLHICRDPQCACHGEARYRVLLAPVVRVRAVGKREEQAG